MIIIDLFDREIRLTDERIKHLIDNHPELVTNNLVDLITTTLKLPDLVIASNSDESVEMLYRYYLHTTVGDKWFCVILKNKVNDYFVVTSYFTDKIKKGKELWKKM